MSVLLTSVATRAEIPAALASERARALDCLASAISYEAGNEPVEGKEAVAQVILNRVRHPAYPKTVCGVVFQGSTRKTGCQFTFTCDGSISRPRILASLNESKLVAEHVLSGALKSAVGGATHYHANYVTPYWASSLIKVTAIGAHLFYRMPGAPDSPAYIVPGMFGVEPQIAGLDASQTASAITIAAPPLPRGGAVAFSPWGLPLSGSSSSR